MLHSANLPLHLWAEAVGTAVYILNRTTSKQTPDITPYELWMGKKPSLLHVRKFGSDAYIHIPSQQRTKLDQKAKKLILVGYQADSTNYRLFDPETKKIIQSRNVTFNEELKHRENYLPATEFRITLYPMPSADVENEEDDEVFHKVEEADQIEPPQVIEDPVQPNDKAEIGRVQLRDRKIIKKSSRYEVNIAECDEPSNVQEAMSTSNAGMSGKRQFRRSLKLTRQMVHGRLYRLMNDLNP